LFVRSNLPQGTQFFIKIVSINHMALVKLVDILN
jgi:hypothetical protein